MIPSMNKVAGKFEVFVGLLQEKYYGYSRERAVKEIDKHMVKYKALLKKRIPTL